MKKYNTRPIDCTGCHPVIAEALKRSEAIECRVWDNNDVYVKRKVCICRYKGSSDLPYRSETDTPWKHAEPIPLKTRRIMPPERAIPVLIANGYEFDTSGEIVGQWPNILPVMLPFMGRVLDGEAVCFNWPPCIIEEVEDDE